MEALFFTLLGLILSLVLVAGPVAVVLVFLGRRRHEGDLRRIEARLLALESQGSQEPQTSAAVSQPSAAAGTPAAPEVSAAGVEGGPLEPPAPARRLDLETLIAGRWLNRIGVLAMLLAAAFFLRFAFENQWVGPLGRVVIGLVAGTALLVASQWFLNRGLRYFSEGIAGLGAGVLFLSLYAAWSFYELIPQLAALLGMVAVTGALAAVALGRGSQRLAVLAVSGGLATPALLASDEDRYLALFAYLAVLLICFLGLAWARTWRWVAPPAFVGVVFYWAQWQAEYFDADELWPAVLLATLLFAIFACYFVARCRASVEASLKLPELLLGLANSGAYGLVLYSLLYEEQRWILTAAVLALGGLHVVAARMIPLDDRGMTAASRLVLAGAALTFATSAIPIRLEGESIPIALSIEAAILVWAGFRSEIRALRLTGAGLLGCVLLLLLSESGRQLDTAFLNESFAAFIVAFAAFLACLLWARSRLDDIGQERLVFGALAVGASLVAVWGLSQETWRFLGQQTWDLDARLAQQMGLSLLWAVAAGLLIAIGVRLSSRIWRWQGLALLAIVIVKVFALDLSFLERAYRIVSLLVLGVVLLAVSFVYQRTLAAEGRAESDGDGGGG